MRKKQPSKQAYARHDRGQSGSSSVSTEGDRDGSRIEFVAVGASESGSVPSLFFRLSLKRDRVVDMLAVVSAGGVPLGDGGKSKQKVWDRFDVIADKVLNTDNTCWRGGAQVDAVVMGLCVRNSIGNAGGGEGISMVLLCRHGSGVWACG